MTTPHAPTAVPLDAMAVPLHGHDHAAHPHGHGHGQDAHDHEDHEHGTHERSGWIDRVLHVVRPHSHDVVDKTDAALESTAEGIRAVRISLFGLTGTALIQAAVFVASGSVALLADTIHNVSDGLTALPLWLAFALARRPTSRRFGYGLGRVEDLAGLAVVLMIAGSALLAGWESLRRLGDPQPVGNLVAVVIAGLVGFAGNEAVAVYRIGVGRRIGSAALVADGRHARADGFTSLGVVVGAAGVALGWRQADPAVGLAITAAILVVLVGAIRDVGRRLLDGVDPALPERAESVLAEIPDVRGVQDLRMRWLGHRLQLEAAVQLDAGTDLTAADRVTGRAADLLRSRIPQLDRVALRACPLSEHTDR